MRQLICTFFSVPVMSNKRDMAKNRFGCYTQNQLYAPLVTCTRTLATSAFDGEHEYFPESAKSAF